MSSSLQRLHAPNLWSLARHTRRLVVHRARPRIPILRALAEWLEQRLLGAAPSVVDAPPPERRARRILVAVAHPDTAVVLIRYAAALVGDGEIVVVTVIGPSAAEELRSAIEARIEAEAQEAENAKAARAESAAPSVPHRANGSDAARELALERLSALRAAVGAAIDAGVPTGFVVRTGRDVGQALRREARRQRAALILLGWRPPSEAALQAAPGEDVNGTAAENAAQNERRVLAPSLRAVVEYPPADVVVVAGEARPEDNLPTRWLVALGVGGDAPSALRLAHLLSGKDGALTVLRILSGRANLAAVELASARLTTNLALTGLARASKLVLRAPDTAGGILKVLEERGYEGVVMPAPRESLFDRLVFGSAQLTVASRSSVPVVVTKARSGELVYAFVRFWRAAYDRLPKLEAAEQAEVRASVASSATPGTDFYVMIALSGIIAAFGLLLNSSAVIIGAMLVAPLMSAIIAVGLGVVEGDLELIRRGIAGSARGSGLAILVAFLVGLVGLMGPTTGLVSEIASRTRPGLLDLGVALASGAAGAYALSRKSLSASLPGVAIAAALVPPLGVVGIGIAMLRYEVALGALLLFLTNFVAIAMAAGLTFLLLGFGPSAGQVSERELVERGVRTAGWLLAVVTIVLAFVTWNLAREVTLERAVEHALHQEIAANPAYTQFQPLQVESWTIVPTDDDTLRLEVSMRMKAELAPQFSYTVAREIQSRLSARLDRPVALVLTVVPTRVLDAVQAPTWTPTASPSPSPMGTMLQATATPSPNAAG